MPDDTLLVLDETKLSAGQLDTIGLNNVKSLARVIEEQKLSFDYQYYQKDFDLCVNTIILTSG